MGVCYRRFGTTCRCHIQVPRCEKKNILRQENEKKGNLLNKCISVEKKQLDSTEWFIALIKCSTCFGRFYAHHQEVETICVL